MSEDTSTVDKRFATLFRAADSCEQMALLINDLDKYGSQLNKTKVSSLKCSSDELMIDLQSSFLSKGPDYQNLYKQSDRIKSFAELTFTLDQCIDDPSRYDQALDILDQIEQLNRASVNEVPLIVELCKNSARQREYLLINLSNSLDDKKDAPIDELKRMVNLLARCGAFTERQLRLRFLQARDLWFNDECDLRSESFDDLISFFCHGLPRIFEEFKAIFGETDSQPTDRFASVRSSSSREDAAIVNSWLLLKTSTFIISLELHLKSLGQSRQLTPTMINDTMKKCFKLTNWLASIGFDFSSQLRPLFSKSILEEVKFNIDRATLKFESEFTRIVSQSIESLLLPIDDDILRVSNSGPEDQVPKSIEHYPVLKIYCLSIIDSLRWIRANQSLMSLISLSGDVYGALNASLSRVMQTIAIILNTDNNSSHPILSKISVALITEVLPFQSNYCGILFPEKIVLSAMGLSKTEYKAIYTKEPERLKDLRLDPPFLNKFLKHLGGNVGMNTN